MEEDLLTWITDNCQEIGETMDTLVSEAFTGYSGPGELGWNVDKNSNGYVGLLGNPEFNFPQLFTDVGVANSISTGALRGTHPAQQLQSNGWGVPAFTALYKEMLKAKTSHAGGNNMAIIMGAVEAGGIKDKWKTADTSVKQLSALISVLKANAPGGHAQQRRGWGWLEANSR